MKIKKNRYNSNNIYYCSVFNLQYTVKSIRLYNKIFDKFYLFGFHIYKIYFWTIGFLC